MKPNKPTKGRVREKLMGLARFSKFEDGEFIGEYSLEHLMIFIKSTLESVRLEGKDEDRAISPDDWSEIQGWNSAIKEQNKLIKKVIGE